MGKTIIEIDREVYIPERPDWLGFFEDDDDMRTEQDLQNYIKRGCKVRGASFDKVESRSRRGFPDCFIAKGGAVYLVEVKSPAGHGRLSDSQVRAIADLEAHGVQVFVIDSQAMADSFLELLDDA